MPQASEIPLVSVGLPVYNGGESLVHTLDALLAQDHPRLELVICDDGSTDGTGRLCTGYAANDTRVRCLRNETRRGQIFNFRRVLESAQGKYFMWAGAHDLWKPTFVSKCVAMLEADPELVMAHPRAIWTDMDGSSLGVIEERIDTRGMSAVESYIHTIWNLNWCTAIYGLFRRATAVEYCRVTCVWGWDHAFLAGLSLRGAFGQLDEPLFHFRRSRAEEDDESRRKRVISALDPEWAKARAGWTMDALNHELRNLHLRIIYQSGLRSGDKLRVWAATFVCFNRRFGVGGPGFSAVEKLAKAVLPQTFRRSVLATPTSNRRP